MTVTEPAAFLPRRPPRRMPTLRSIARHWDAEVPCCFRCGWQPPVDTWTHARGWLERAHLIDRWAGGLDLETNIVALCRTCHRTQPIFEPGDEEEALAWAEDPTACPALLDFLLTGRISFVSP